MRKKMVPWCLVIIFLNVSIALINKLAWNQLLLGGEQEK